MKKSMMILLSAALLILAGCSGEAYIEVANQTADNIMVSVNDQPDEVVASGDTSDLYTIRVIKNAVNYIDVEASGDWLNNYSESVSISAGETVTHRVQPNLADVEITNGSQDSAECNIDGDELLFAGHDVMNISLEADGRHDVAYSGRYMFETLSTESWMPGISYTLDLIPNACELEIDNLHDNYVIYYIYFSPTSSETWGDDRLGDDILNPMEGYVWKVEGDKQWDFRIEAGDPDPDSTLHVYEFYDTQARAADYTYIYEFPTIFDEVFEKAGKLLKSEAGQARMKYSGQLAKNMSAPAVKVEKVRKTNVGSDSKAKRIER